MKIRVTVELLAIEESDGDNVAASVRAKTFDTHRIILYESWLSPASPRLSFDAADTAELGLIIGHRPFP